jgi:phospholipase/carboxylesterase
MHARQVIEAGIPVAKASKALLMLHGRGATAQDILSLTNELPLDDFYVVAPQATNFTWYPFSFLEPVSRNEPWLSSALHLIRDIIHDINKAGIPSEKIFILGFSQGACLTLEFASRNATRWGGVFAFTGGLIGDVINRTNYVGNFAKTPVFIGNSDSDPHVPLTRTEESAAVMKEMGALVTVKIYPQMPHTVNRDEIAMTSAILKS